MTREEYQKKIFELEKQKVALNAQIEQVNKEFGDSLLRELEEQGIIPGAKVSVKFNKVTTNATMRYYVQKKVSGKTSGKSIGSTKTTLSVKKGATVKVRVKAYYYDENGSKHVGAYSAWKTLKTDKK